MNACEDARAIFDAALKAADPAEAVRRHLRRTPAGLQAAGYEYPLGQYRRVFLIGAGKASAAMAAAVEEILGDRLDSGLVVVKYGHTAKLRKTRLLEAGHPVPDENGARATREIAELAAQTGPEDLVIVVISGGASALLTLPADGITLADKQEVTQQMLRCGATIDELNAVRKHLSAIKGGQLARLLAPSQVLCLLLSDVVGDPLDVIGSGPTAPDNATFCDSLEVLRKYALCDQIPASVRRRLSGGTAPETPKPGDPIFKRVQNLIVGSNALALQAASERATALGYRALLLSTSIRGETRDVAAVHGAIAREIRRSGQPIAAPACILSGGETTVSVRGSGVGGRNQEFALAAAIEIAGLENVAVLSGGTDGSDGPTPAAGAIATGESVQQAARKGLQASHFLAENDSYHFWNSLGGLIETGPTNTNVMDIHLVLVL